MIQKIFAVALAILGTWMLQRFYYVFGIIPIIFAVLFYRGVDHGVWFYFDWNSDRDNTDSSGDWGD